MLCEHSEIASISDFEHKGHCILFFVDEMKYILAKRKILVDENDQVMSTVSVKISGNKCTGTLMFIGKLL